MRVLVFPRDIRRADNPYGELLYRDMLGLGVEVDCFSLRRAFGGGLWRRYDVFHLHWPEYYLNRSLPKALMGTLMVLLSTAWLRRRGTRILWTVTTLTAMRFLILPWKRGSGEDSPRCSTASSV